MSNKTQHRIQATLNKKPINHAKPNIASHSSKILKYSDHNQTLVF